MASWWVINFHIFESGWRCLLTEESEIGYFALTKKVFYFATALIPIRIILSIPRHKKKWTKCWARSLGG